MQNARAGDYREIMVLKNAENRASHGAARENIEENIPSN
jgi:hypothetical protein